MPDLNTSRRAAALNKAYHQFTITPPEPGSYTSMSSLRKIDEAVKKKAVEDWQEQNILFYEEIPEVAYVLNITARMLSQCRVYVREETEHNVHVASSDERVVRALQSLQGEFGGLPEILRSAALNMQLLGEAYLLGTPVKSGKGKKGGDVQYLWEFVSSKELVVSDKTYERRRSGSGASRSNREVLGADAYIARMWRRHPVWSDQSDCDLRHCRRICSELLTLTQLIRAVANSRMNAGILAVPMEASFGPDDVTLEGDDQGDIDPFIESIIEYFTAPVMDPESVAAISPFVMRIPGEHIKEFGIKQIARDLDKYAVELRMELIRRLGSGMDVPPEVLSGKHGLNQWTAFQVDHQFAHMHIKPLGEMIIDFLTQSYLRPILMAYEGMTFAEASQFSFYLDISPIAVRADEATQALRLYREKAISLETLIRSSGYTPADMPSDVELRQRNLLEVVLSAPALLPYIAPLLEGFEGVDIPVGSDVRLQKPDVVAPDENNREVNLVRPGREDDRVPVDPNGGGVPRVGTPGSRSGRRGTTPVEKSIVDRVAVAADAAHTRAMEKASARFFTKAKLPDKDKLRSVDKLSVFSTVSASDVSSVGESPVSLIGDSFSEFQKDVRVWVQSWFENNGIQQYVASDEAKAIAEQVRSDVESFTIREFFNPPAYHDNGLKIPDEVIFEGLSSTGRSVS